MRQIIKRLIISLLILLLLIIVGGGGWVYWRARASLAQLEGAIQVAGLSAPVEVLRDARGVLTFVPPRSRICSSHKVT